MKLNWTRMGISIFWVIMITQIVTQIIGCNEANKKPYDEPNTPIENLTSGQVDTVAHWKLEAEKIQAAANLDKELTRNRSWCFWAIVLGVAAMVVGWNIPLVQSAGLAAIVAGGTGYGITYASTTYPVYFAIGGLAIGLGGLGIAGYLIWLKIVPQLKKKEVALAAVVAGNEAFKKAVVATSSIETVPTLNALKIAQNNAQGSTPDVKSEITQTVEAVRAEITK